MFKDFIALVLLQYIKLGINIIFNVERLYILCYSYSDMPFWILDRRHLNF